MTDLQKIIFIPFISLLPCVVWLVYFYTHSRYKRPPLRLIVLTFALGAFSTIPFFPDSVPTASQIAFEVGSTIPFITSFTVPTGTIGVSAVVVAAADGGVAFCVQAAKATAAIVMNVNSSFRIVSPSSKH